MGRKEQVFIKSAQTNFTKYIGNNMKVVTKYFVCGVTCKPGGKNCNNYCNHDRSKHMPDSPATYEDLVMEEIDMWKDVVEMLAEYVPGDKTIFELLQAKYKISVNNKQQ